MTKKVWNYLKMTKLIYNLQQKKRIIMSSESFKMGWELNKCSYLSSDSDRNHVSVVLFCCLRENAGLLHITKQKCSEKHIFCEKAWPSLAKQTLYFGISTWKSCTVLNRADLLPDAVFNISVMCDCDLVLSLAGVLIKISCRGVTRWWSGPFRGSTVTSSPAPDQRVSKNRSWASHDSQQQ